MIHSHAEIANHSPEMRSKVVTVGRKCFQRVLTSTKHGTETIQRKMHATCLPLCRKCTPKAPILRETRMISNLDVELVRVF